MGSNRAQNPEAILGDVLDFPCFLMVLQWFWGVLIIPKWLIHDSGHIPIFLGTFLELPKNRPNMDLWSLSYYRKGFNEYQKIWKDLIEVLFV